jgi:hypothetical protein
MDNKVNILVDSYLDYVEDCSLVEAGDWLGDLSSDIKNKVTPFSGEYDGGIGAGGYALIAAAIAAAGVGAMALYRKVKASKNQCHKKCGTYGVGKARKVCIAKCIIPLNQKEITMLKKSLSKSSKTKDPAKCKASITKRIRKLQDEIGKSKIFLKHAKSD